MWDDVVSPSSHVGLKRKLGSWAKSCPTPSPGSAAFARVGASSCKGPKVCKVLTSN